MKKIKNKTKTKEFPQGKPTVEWSVSYLKFQLEYLERKYDENARNYASYVNQGVALTNIHVLDTLRALTWLYTDIAAHRHALMSLKTEFAG